MDGKLFLGTAHFLKDKGTNEADYRSSISRAYYACFLEARRIAFGNCGERVREKAKIWNEKYIGHENLQYFLKQSAIERIRQLGENLAGLHGNRKNADYDMTKSVSSQDAKDALDEAGEFLKDISQISPKEIGQSIENYLNEIYPNKNSPFAALKNQE